MGMGEPLHNFDNLTRALALLEHPWGAGFSPRRITVSTAGLVSGIDKLAAAKSVADRLGPQPGHLAQRHHRRGARPDHADQQALADRGAAGGRAPLSALARAPGHLRVRDARRRQRQRRRRRPTAAAAAGHPQQGEPHSLEPVPGRRFARPSEAASGPSRSSCAARVPVYIRTPRGDDIDAACGQLAARKGEGSAGFFNLKATRRVS